MGCSMRASERPRLVRALVLWVMRCRACLSSSSSVVAALANDISEWKLFMSASLLPPTGIVAPWRVRGRPEFERRNEMRSAARATSNAAAYRASTLSAGGAYTGDSVSTLACATFDDCARRFPRPEVGRTRLRPWTRGLAGTVESRVRTAGPGRIRDDLGEGWDLAADRGVTGVLLE